MATINMFHNNNSNNNNNWNRLSFAFIDIECIIFIIIGDLLHTNERIIDIIESFDAITMLTMSATNYNCAYCVYTHTIVHFQTSCFFVGVAIGTLSRIAKLVGTNERTNDTGSGISRFRLLLIASKSNAFFFS